MAKGSIALFAESEHGPFQTLNQITSINSLYETAGNLNNPSTYKLVFSALEIGYDLLFWRVKDEGTDVTSYLKGLEKLKRAQNIIAFYLPGVSEAKILPAARRALQRKKMYNFNAGARPL